MSNEEKELKLIIGDDGVLKKYNDEYDITIHCESEAEAEKAMEKLEHVNDLRDYLTAITDSAFLKMNYGITDIDIQFVRTFNPDTLIRDYKEWMEAADDREQ